MKALIIEDEPRARAHMISLLADSFPEVEVVGAIGSVKDSIQWLGANPTPDVIFMDVELSDGNSFEIFANIDVPAPVIMTTAYDQYAIRAFQVNAVDYLLKPIDVEDLKRAIGRVSAGETSRPESVRKMIDQAFKEKFLIKLNDRIVPVRASDIAYVYSESKNTYIVTSAGSSYVLDDSLDTIAASLDPASFFRISRSCIISEGVIDSVSRLMGGRLRITLRPEFPALADFTVSRARVDDFLSWLEK